MSLTARQKKAIPLLLAGSKADAARAIGVTEKTLYNWLDDDEFRYELAAAEEEMLAAVNNRLIGLQGKALDVIEQILDTATDSVRLRAAIAVLEARYQITRDNEAPAPQRVIIAYRDDLDE